LKTVAKATGQPPSAITGYKTSATPFVYGLLLFHPLQHTALAIDYNSSIWAKSQNPSPSTIFYEMGVNSPAKISIAQNYS